MPRENVDYWRKKIGQNAERDRRNIGDLRADGWSVIEAWECDVKADVTAVATAVELAVRERLASPHLPSRAYKFREEAH